MVARNLAILSRRFTLGLVHQRLLPSFCGAVNRHHESTTGILLMPQEKMEDLAELPIRAAAMIVFRESILAGSSLPQVLMLIDEFLVDFPNQIAFNKACECGASVQALEFLLERSTPDWECAASTAARKGRVHVLRWMLAKRQECCGPSAHVARDRPWQCELESSLCDAAGFGHLAIVELLYEHGIRKEANKAMIAAARGGHLNVVKWLHKRNENTSIEVAILAAAAKGYLGVVQWHHSQWCAWRIRDPTLIGNIGLRYIVEAVMGGHLEVVQWLYQNGYELCSTYAINYAAEHGYLDVVKWLHMRHGYRVSAKSFANSSHLDVLKWMEQEYGVDYMRTLKSKTRTMDKAASEGKLDVVEWLHSHNEMFSCTTDAMDDAAGNGHLEMVQWLHTTRQEGCTTGAMNKAAGSGHLAVVKWLHENRKEGCTTRAMDMAAKHGHLDVLSWLYEYRSEGCSSAAIFVSCPHESYGSHMQICIYSQSKSSSHESCEESPEAISWLVEKFPASFDLNTIAEAATQAADFGHLKTVQLLASRGLFANPKYFTQVFDSAILSYHVHVMEWLLSLSVKGTRLRELFIEGWSKPFLILSTGQLRKRL